MNTETSKALSYLLRHGAVKEGIAIDDNGYVKIDDVIGWLRNKGHGATQAMLQNITKKDSKGRYDMTNTHIRANQGHSIELRQELKPLGDEVRVALHCSFMKHMDAIAQEGLRSMTRTHVHMVALTNNTPWHLLRKNSDLYVLVDVVAARADGIKFEVSDNNVVLVEGALPAKYLTMIPAHERKSGCYGFVVTSMDEILIVRTPKGVPGFPKGKHKKDELSLQCALRELYEETSLNVDDVTILPGSYIETNDNGSVSAVYYRAQCASKLPICCLDKEEGLTVTWSTVEQLGDLSPKRRTVLQNMKLI